MRPLYKGLYYRHLYRALMSRVQGARRAALTGGGESVALGGDVLAETALLGQTELVQQLTATGTNELVQHWAKEKQ